METLLGLIVKSSRGFFHWTLWAKKRTKKNLASPDFLKDNVLIKAISAGKSTVGNPINSHAEKETFGDFEWDGRPSVDVHVWAEYLFIRSHEFDFRHSHGRRGRSLAAGGAPSAMCRGRPESDSGYSIESGPLGAPMLNAGLINARCKSERSESNAPAAGSTTTRARRSRTVIASSKHAVCP